MADNPATPLANGLQIAADDIAGVLWQRMKMAFGADGSATEVSAAAPLPTRDASGAPSVTYVPVTPGSTNLTGGACRAILAETAGRVNLKQPDGTARANFPLQAGYNPIGALMIDAPTSGTAATGVWAIY